MTQDANFISTNFLLNQNFEQKGNNWLEPMREVILLSSQAKILLSQGDKTQIRAFLKNIGSNFMLNSKRLVMPKADPPLAENFPEKRLASPRSGPANDFIS